MRFMLLGKQVGLDGAALLHDGRIKDQVATILPRHARVRFFEVPLRLLMASPGKKAGRIAD
jgi:hypothetical protein